MPKDRERVSKKIRALIWISGHEGWRPCWSWLPAENPVNSKVDPRLPADTFDLSFLTRFIHDTDVITITDRCKLILPKINLYKMCNYLNQDIADINFYVNFLRFDIYYANKVNNCVLHEARWVLVYPNQDSRITWVCSVPLAVAWLPAEAPSPGNQSYSPPDRIIRTSAVKRFHSYACNFRYYLLLDNFR